jgi:hypothetical protein
MFFGMVFIPKITIRGDVQRIRCANLLDELPNRPQLVEVRGYRTDDVLMDAAVHVINGAGGSNWYVPLVPVEEAGELADGEFPVLVRLSESEFHDFEQGAFRGRLKYPACDVPLLSGSGESALLEQRPDLVDPQRGWILSGWSGGAGLDPLTIGFPLVMFVGFCALFGGMLVGPLDDPDKRLTVGIVGVSLIALGAGWLLYNPRLTPLLNGLLPGTALYCAVFGAALCVVFAFGLASARGNRRRLQVNEGLTGAHAGDAPFEILDDGFIVRDQRGERRYRDRDVRGIIHVKRQQIGRDGGVSRYDRELTLRIRTDVKEKEDVQRLKHAYRVGELDTLEPFAERVLAGLVERTWHELGAGGRLTVGGWTVDRDQLTFESGGRFEAVPLKEVTAIEEQDACLHAWRRGVDRPFLEISLLEENGEVMMGVLRRHLAEYGAAADNTFTGELGRMLFERRKASKKAAGEAAALIVIVVLFAFQARLGPFGPGALLVYALGGLAAALHVLHAAGGGVVAYERGLVVRRWFRPTTIRYKDLSGLTFRTKEHFQNGIYSGSVTAVEFLADAPGGPQKVSFKHEFKHRDERLESIRNAAAGAIASRLWRELHESGSVQWSPHVRITPTGLEYRSHLLNRKEEKFLPFESVTNVGLDEGRFQIYTAESTKPAITIDSGGANFFPGLELWQRVADAAARTATREATASMTMV